MVFPFWFFSPQTSHKPRPFRHLVFKDTVRNVNFLCPSRGCSPPRPGLSTPTNSSAVCFASKYRNRLTCYLIHTTYIAQCTQTKWNYYSPSVCCCCFLLFSVAKIRWCTACVCRVIWLPSTSRPSHFQMNIHKSLLLGCCYGRANSNLSQLAPRYTAIQRRFSQAFSVAKTLFVLFFCFILFSYFLRYFQYRMAFCHAHTHW